MTRPIGLVAGERTPFTRVDGGLAKRDAIGLSVPVDIALWEIHEAFSGQALSARAS